MKRLLLIFFIIIALSDTLSAQNYVPKNYRSLSECGQDTIAYLKHNWGLRSINQFKNRTVGEFLDIYDLPIVSVMLRLGGSERLAIIRLFYMPPEMEESNPQMAEKYHVCLDLARGDNPVDQRPSKQMLDPIFKGLKPYTNVVYPWREEYRELMKDWVLEDVQYNYGIFDAE